MLTRSKSSWHRYPGKCRQFYQSANWPDVAGLSVLWVWAPGAVEWQRPSKHVVDTRRPSRAASAVAYIVGRTQALSSAPPPSCKVRPISAHHVRLDPSRHPRPDPRERRDLRRPGPARRPLRRRVRALAARLRLGARPRVGRGFNLWQLVTYAFLHGNTLHLFFNMFALYMFGGEIERVFGPRRYLQYYFVTVIVAAITQLVVSGVGSATPYPTVGASGACSGSCWRSGCCSPDA